MEANLGEAKRKDRQFHLVCSEAMLVDKYYDELADRLRQQPIDYAAWLV